MTPEDQAIGPEVPQPPAVAPNSRRRLLRGGLAAAPAVLTLVNRPVMAAHCVPSSASVSANLSRGTTPAICQLGMSPGTWSLDSSFAEWPTNVASPGAPAALAGATSVVATGSALDGKDVTASTSSTSGSGQAAPSAGPAVPAGTTFNSVFGSQGGYGKKTLLEVLRFNSNGGRDGLARHLVAAYLNAVKGYTPAVVLDVATTKNIWTSFVARGYFEPTAGIRWFPDYAEPASPRGGLIAWIKTTMPR